MSKTLKKRLQPRGRKYGCYLIQFLLPRRPVQHISHLAYALSVKNPHHYRLTILVPALDEQGLEMRHAAANPAISYFRHNLKLALPQGSSEKLVEERLHQILASLHGMTIMLITHPRAYKLTRDAALWQLESAFEIFLNAPEVPRMTG